jgi:hypothetical protein
MIIFNGNQKIGTITSFFNNKIALRRAEFESDIITFCIYC